MANFPYAVRLLRSCATCILDALDYDLVAPVPMLDSAGHGCWANCESGSCSFVRASPSNLRVSRPAPPWRQVAPRRARETKTP